MVIVVWVALVPLVLVGAGRFSSALVTSDAMVSGSASQQAARMIAGRFPSVPPETDIVVMHSETLNAHDPVFAQQVEATIAAFRDVSGVVQVTNPLAAPAELVSADRHTVLVPVGVGGDAAARQGLAGTLQRVAASQSSAQVSVQVTGTSPMAAAGIEEGNTDVARSDEIALPLAGVVLLLAFGSVLAACLPLALGGAGVLTAFGLLGALSLVLSFDVFTRTAVMMLSIALGIDYALIMVTRFREELTADHRGDESSTMVAAVGRTVATAGHAVAFSGVAVMASLSGLLLVRTTRVQSMALGMSAAVAAMMLLTLTLLPAALALLGHRVNAIALPWARRGLAHPDPEHSLWARIAGLSVRRPVVVAALALAVLGALAGPATHLRYGVADQLGSIAGTPAGHAYTMMAHQFPAGSSTPVQIVVADSHGPLDAQGLDVVARLSSEAAADPGVATVSSLTLMLDQRLGGHDPARLAAARHTATGGLGNLLNPAGDTTVISVTPREGVYSPTSAQLVEDLRSQAGTAAAGTPLTVVVGGAPAQIIDSVAENSRATPRVIAAVLAVEALILLLAFRSLLLPVKAVLMNLCTVGAAFGAMVLVFQDGHGAGLLGLTDDGFIQVFVPLIAFTFVFGLSMDYEVFLLTRIQEAWHATGDNPAAIRTGIAHTARLITAAAAIMLTVFASFMRTSVTDVQQLGFMLAVAVLLDATVVRLFLVPALMRLMGRWNWWLPSLSGRRHNPRPPDLPVAPGHTTPEPSASAPS